MGKLANQVAVVTGASKGIGAGIAKALAAEGASVVVNYSSSKEAADKVVKEITTKGGEAMAVQGDVSKQADINIGSGASTILPPNTSVYSATKAAVDAITGTLAKELGPRKIRVNSINPGMIETEGVVSGGFSEGEFRKRIAISSPHSKPPPKNSSIATLISTSLACCWPQKKR